MEVDPVTEEFTSELDPVTFESAVALEPATDGVEVTLDVGDEAAGLLVAEGFDTAELDEEPVVAPVADALVGESGVQSMWTGPLEWSFALPVFLSASFPALGWLSSLHRGLVAASCCAAPAFAFALVLPSTFCVLAVGSFIVLGAVLWAKAGAAPMRAAMARVLRYWERIMLMPPGVTKEKNAYERRAHG